MGTSRETMMYALNQRKKKTSTYNNLSGVGRWSTDVKIKGGKFPVSLMNDASSVNESFANASGSGVLTCKALHFFNNTKYNDCLKTYNQGATNDFELARLQAENERLAIEAANKLSNTMSGGSIALITIGSIAALTGMVILIKKYGK